MMQYSLGIQHNLSIRGDPPQLTTNSKVYPSEEKEKMPKLKLEKKPDRTERKG
jgi:hypothetical protein